MFVAVFHEFSFGKALGVFLVVIFFVAFDENSGKCREGVDDGGADAVEAAREFVSALAKFAAGVEFGHADFETRETGRMHVYWDAGTVITDGGGAVGVDGDPDVSSTAGKGFVNGVVNDFAKEFVVATHVGGADVHAWAFADGFKAFENLDVFGGVGLISHGIYVTLTNLLANYHELSWLWHCSRI